MTELRNKAYLHLSKRHLKTCFACFLLAQFLYSKAFWMQLSDDHMVWWLPALLVAASIVAFFLLLPQIDTVIFPVSVMGIMLIQLAWASGESWLQMRTEASLAGFAGSIVWIFSAVLLAINDYRCPLKWGSYCISGSYLIAQSLIAASLVL